MRLSLGFVDHRKTKKLQRRLGAAGVLALLTLWSRAGDRRPDGDLTGMNNEDIAIDAGWDGDADAFVHELVDIGWLDGEPGSYQIHDWADEQPWLNSAEERSEAARHAALVKHGKAEPRARKKREVCAPHAPSSQNRVSGSAPSPSPIPDPIPSPIPSPDRGIAPARDLPPSSTPPREVVVEVVLDGASGGDRGPAGADRYGAAVAGATDRPGGPAGLPKPPATPYRDDELAAIAALLPNAKPAAVPDAIKSWLQQEQTSQVVNAWNDLGAGLRAAWSAEGIRRAIEGGKKPADRLRSASRHIARALHDGFDLLEEDWKPRGSVIALAGGGPMAAIAPTGRPMSNQARNMAVLRAAAAGGGS
jgi:hypothetical protein